jgi:hypothetical protein
MSQTRAALAVTLFLMSPALLGNQAGQVRTTAKQELERLQLPDAAQYASGLYDNSGRWSYVSNKIATGEQNWLQVAKLLIPNADGAFAEELRSDLALALLVRPTNVLRLVQTSRSSGVTPTDVCGAPFPSPGKVWLSRYKTRAITSVRRVREAGLSKLRDDCLSALRGIDLSRPAEAYE